MRDAIMFAAALTRRRFLGATAVGTAALAGWSALEWHSAPQAQAGRPRTGSPWVVPFNTGWLFGPAGPGSTAPQYDDSGLATVTLPHTVTSLSWREWNPDTWERTWVYRKHFAIPAQARGKRVFLDVGAALTAVTPVLNGHTLPTHVGGYLPAETELTDYLSPGGNVLALGLDSRFGIDVPPDRPAPYTSRSNDFWAPGGIYRDVRLRIVPQIFIADVFAKPVNVLNVEARRLEVRCTVDAAVVPASALTIEVELLDGTRVVSSATTPVPVRRTGQVSVTATLSRLAHVALWDTGNPKLYAVRVTLRAGGTPLHDYQVRTGFREAIFRRDGFFLNGRRVQLTGLNRHQFYPFAGGALPARVQRKDAEILRQDLNCNVVRCSHYPQSEAFLDACDELGLLVWEEIPGWGYLGDGAWQNAAARDLQDMIVRDRSHPSIVIWGAMPNEGGEHPAVYTRYRDLARSLDDSRPTGGDGYHADARFVFDVFTFHDYGSVIGPDGLRRPALAPPHDAARKPYLVCEAIGAISGPAVAYRRTDPQQLQQGLATAHGQALSTARSSDQYCGLISWSGFDYLTGASGNCLGGVKYTGVMDQFRVPKPGAAIYQSQVDPRVRPVIAPAFYWDFGPASPVTLLSQAMICANLDRLELFVDGAHYATVRPTRAGYEHLPYPPSFADFTGVDGTAHPELRIDGYLGDVKVASRTLSSDPSADRLAVAADDSAVTADGTDATRVEIRAVDAYGNARPYVTGDVTLSVAGPGALLGDSPFAFGEAGGAGAVWIRTLPGAPGTITVTATHPALGTGTAVIDAVPPAVVPAIPIGPAGPMPSGALTVQSSPEVVTPGSLVTLTASFRNNGILSLSGVALSPQLPAGWSAAAIAATTFTGVAADQSVQASWRVTVPRHAYPQLATLTVQSSYVTGRQRGVTQASTVARVPYASLASAYRNTGITADSGSPAGGQSSGGQSSGGQYSGGQYSGGLPSGSTAANGLTGTGLGYPAAALAAAGLTPGAAIRTPDGLEYTWPRVPPGQPDNALGSGQTVLVDGKPGATTLGLLGTSTAGNCFGTVTVHYADGSSDARYVYFQNWSGGPSASGPGQSFSIVAAVPLPGLKASVGNVYAVTVPVNSAKRVVAVTLPDRSRIASPDVNAAHIFALTTGTPVEYGSLAAAFNNHGPFPRQSLAAAGIRPGTQMRYDGMRFSWPDVAPGRPDNVLALGQTVRVSGLGTRLGFLGASSPSRMTGTGTVHYADGSASDFTFTLDGYGAKRGGENLTVAVVSGGSARVLFAAVRIVPGREVRAVTLPPNGIVPGRGEPRGMHIYAMAVG